MDAASELTLLKRALRLYAGQHVVDRVLEMKERAFDLDGQVVAASLMFVDVARFQPSADKCEPSTVEQVVNHYLGVVTSSSAH